MAISNDTVVLVFSLLLIISVLTTKFSSRFGLPSLVFYIAVGMVLNSFMYYDNANLTQFVGVAALIIILFEGGLQTKWSNVRPVIAPSLSLATLGVILTTITVGVAAKFILGVSWLEGMLFGAIVGSTDAAAVFTVIGGKNIKQHLKTMLEAESGSNDPMAVLLTVSIIEFLKNPDATFYTLFLTFFVQMTLGLLMGVVMGKVSIWAINKINLDSSGLYPVFAVAFAVFTYSFTSLIHGSGLLAVYVLGVLLGNADLTYRHSIYRFNEGFAWMAQICMFILLGLLVFPQDLLSIAWQGLILSFLLMFVARPIGVFLTIPFMGINLKEKIFISWSGLRGAVPIVLATYPLIAGLEIGQLFFNVVFFVVVTSALIQGATISPLASWLGLTERKRVVAQHSLELVSIGKTNTEIVELVIEEGSIADGNEIKNLQLPKECLVTAVIRADKVITPKGSTKLQVDDILYIMIPKTHRENIKPFFAAVDPTVEGA